MSGLLEGLKVIEVGHVVAVPAASAMLGDWGADVIKVEPLTGDLTRGTKRSHGADRMLKLAGGEVNWMIQLLNRSKRSVAIDLRQDQGRKIVYQLIREADVFMSNYESGSLKKLKLDYDTLSQINPRLIYAIVTGYGTVGPDKEERGFDVAAWARSGAQYLTGEAGNPPPSHRGGMLDRVVSAHIVAGILAALLHKEKTGQGQELDCSLFHTSVWVNSSDIQAAVLGLPCPQGDRTRAPNPLWNNYRTKDDRWFQLAMLQSALHWLPFCRAINKLELVNDPRFNTLEEREKNSKELISILDEVFSTESREEWERRFRENNCIYGRVQTPDEVVNDPQAVANGFFREMEHPAGKLKLITTPVNFHQDPASFQMPAPEVGEHTEAILLDLGYSWEDIAQLKEQKVIL